MVLLTSGQQRHDGGIAGMVSEDRMKQLEARMAVVEGLLRTQGAGVGSHPTAAAPPAPVSVALERSVAPPLPAPPPRALTLPRPAVPDLEQLLGGRVLAWLGGAAVLVGLALLLALAIASGWLGELARTLLAGAG
jgi:uncharacterized membrane protein